MVLVLFDGPVGFKEAEEEKSSVHVFLNIHSSSSSSSDALQVFLFGPKSISAIRSWFWLIGSVGCELQD